MSHELVISIIAADRPGIVERIADLVESRSGNWVDSSMARLGGDFAGIVRVSLPSAYVDGLRADLDALATEGVTVSVREGTSQTKVKGDWVRLEVTGGDQPGIVHTISSVLSNHGISIDEFETRVEPTSMAGGDLFTAEAWLLAPEAIDLEKVRSELETIAADIMIELSFYEADDIAA